MAPGQDLEGERGGARYPSAAPSLLATPGMTTARFWASPSTPALATSAAVSHITLGSEASASSSLNPAAWPNPVATGPGHRAVTDTPSALSSACSAWL